MQLLSLGGPQVLRQKDGPALFVPVRALVPALCDTRGIGVGSGSGSSSSSSSIDSHSDGGSNRPFLRDVALLQLVIQLPQLGLQFRVGVGHDYNCWGRRRLVGIEVAHHDISRRYRRGAQAWSVGCNGLVEGEGTRWTLQREILRAHGPANNGRQPTRDGCGSTVRTLSRDADGAERYAGGYLL